MTHVRRHSERKRLMLHKTMQQWKRFREIDEQATPPTTETGRCRQCFPGDSTRSLVLTYCSLHIKFWASIQWENALWLYWSTWSLAAIVSATGSNTPYLCLCSDIPPAIPPLAQIILCVPSALVSGSLINTLGFPQSHQLTSSTLLSFPLGHFVHVAVEVLLIFLSVPF